MTPVRVKICGITRRDDARAAVAAGAHAIGFVFWPRSPRAIDGSAAREIARLLPAMIVRVGVFVNMPADDVRATVEAVGLDVVQLHGDERVDDFRRVGARLLKAIAIDGEAALEAALRLPDDVMPLVDAVDRERKGGTGRPADWGLAARLASARPTVLAGGLSAGNVEDALRAVRPWAIDVSSGVESAPGVKDHAKLQALFARVRGLRKEDM
jgi:phosphoribosylanthranilate isomerase